MATEEGLTLPSPIGDALSYCHGMAYPNVSVILQLLLLIPVTAVTVERGNSSLKFIKSELRSSMTSARLNALLRLLIHLDIDVDLDAVIDSFAHAHSHR